MRTFRAILAISLLFTASAFGYVGTNYSPIVVGGPDPAGITPVSGGTVDTNLVPLLNSQNRFMAENTFLGGTIFENPTNHIVISGAGESAVNQDYWLKGPTNIDVAFGIGSTYIVSEWTNANNSEFSVLFDSAGPEWFVTDWAAAPDAVAYQTSGGSLDDGFDSGNAPDPAPTGAFADPYSGMFSNRLYANSIFSPKIVGGKLYGDASALTNLTIQYPTAGAATNGIISSNAFVLSQVFPGWLDGQERVPRRYIEVPDLTESFDTNFIITVLNPSGLKTNGFRGLLHDTETWRVVSSGNVVRDPVTHLLLWNTNNFPDGPVLYFNYLKTNGLYPSIWYDTTWTASRYSDLAVNDISNAVTWAKSAGVDINFRLDVGSQEEAIYEMPRIISAIQNSGNVSFMLGVGGDKNTSPNYSTVAPWNFLYAGGVRIHGPCGDINNNYPCLMGMIPFMETNGFWKYTMPGRFAFAAGVYSTGNVGTNQLVYTAAMRNQLNLSLGSTISDYQHFGSNPDVLAIQGDPACIASRVALVTNGCYVLIGPLGSAYGPDYSLALFNTNLATTASFTLTFADLSRWLSGSSYTVRDCLQSTQGGVATTLAISLHATNAALYRLISTTPVSSSAGFLMHSNTLASIAAMVPGDTAFWPSNGRLYLIEVDQTGTRTTNAVR